jgi:hypothetical protein
MKSADGTPFRLAGVLIAAVFVAAGCVSAGSMSASPDLAPVSTATSALTPSSSDASTDDHACFGSGLTRDGGPELISDFVAKGMTFAAGTVVSTGPAFFNTTDGTKPRGMGATHPINAQAYPMIYTPVEVKIDRAITGAVKPGAVRLLVEGGAVGCITMSVEGTPVVAKGDRYVFVLTPALDADRKMLGSQLVVYTVFPIDQDGNASTRDGIMSLDALAAKANGSDKVTPSVAPLAS